MIQSRASPSAVFDRQWYNPYQLKGNKLAGTEAATRVLGVNSIDTNFGPSFGLKIIPRFFYPRQ